MTQDATSFDPSAVCLTHCYTYCPTALTSLVNHKPHKHKLRDLIDDDSSQNHDLARQICEYLLSCEQHKDKCAKYVHSLYAKLVEKVGHTITDWKLAEKHYLKAIELNPNDSSLYNNYAVLLDDKLNNTDKAIIYYKKSLDLSPQSIIVNRNLAHTLTTERKYEESMQYWQNSNMNSIDEEGTFYLLRYCDALFNVSKFKECSSMLKKCMSFGKTLNKRRKRMKSYCKFLIADDHRSVDLGRLAIDIIAGNQEKCFELWYNNQNYCTNIRINTLVTLMQIGNVPIESLLKFIQTKINDHITNIDCHDIGVSIDTEFEKLTKKRNEVNKLMDKYWIPLFLRLNDLSEINIDSDQQVESPQLQLVEDDLQLQDNSNDHESSVKFLSANQEMLMKKNKELERIMQIKDKSQLLDEYRNTIKLLNEQKHSLENEFPAKIKEISFKRQELDVCIFQNTLYNSVGLSLGVVFLNRKNTMTSQTCCKTSPQWYNR